MKNSNTRFVLMAAFVLGGFALGACSQAPDCPGLANRMWLEPFQPGQDFRDARESATAKGLTLRNETPHNVESRLRIIDFSHLEIFGELRLYFFRDKLYKMRFYPDNPDAYLAAFQPWLIQTKKNDPVLQTEIALVEDPVSGEKFSEWHNECLSTAFNEWVANQATQP